MKHPLQSVAEIQERLKMVDYFVNVPVAKNVLQNQIKRLPDLDALYFLFYKADSKKKVRSDVSDLIKLHRTITILQDLTN